jgi:hypothetical protein
VHHYVVAAIIDRSFGVRLPAQYWGTSLNQVMGSPPDYTVISSLPQKWKKRVVWRRKYIVRESYFVFTDGAHFISTFESAQQNLWRDVVLYCTLIKAKLKIV